MLIALKGITANQFRQPVCLMCVRGANGPHFVQNNVDLTFGQLPRRFRAGEASSGDYGSFPQVREMQVLF